MKIQLDFAAVLSEWPLLLTGVAWTLALTLASVLVGTLLGIACAWVRGRGLGATLAPGWLRALGACRGPRAAASQPVSTVSEPSQVTGKFRA